MSSETTSTKVVLQERVEVREVMLNDEDDRTQKELDIGWANGEAKEEKIERSIVFRVNNKFKRADKELLIIVNICNLRCISRH